MKDDKTLPAELAAITGPSTTPPNLPDENTALEKQSNDVKKLTPTQLADVYHRGHIQSLNDRIDHLKYECDQLKTSHKDECEQLKTNHSSNCSIFKTEIDELQAQIGVQQQRVEALIEECTELRTTARSTSCLTTFGTLLIVIGGTSIALGSSPMKISDDVKVGLIWVGFGVVICGVGIGVVTWWLTPSSRKKTSH